MPGRRPRPVDPYAFPYRADRAVDSLVVSDHPALHGPAADDGRDPDAPATRPSPIELVDPVIVGQGEEVVWDAEACLSLPCVRGLRVHRPDRIVVRGADRHGRVRTFEASGFIAEIFSHELDHLDGHLYPERAEELVYDPDFRPHDGDA
jgi:peptide deformylase